MSVVWQDLEGHTLNGVFPLGRCIASTDQSAVFLTAAAKHASSALALKLVRVDPTLADAQLARWLAAATLSHAHLIRIFEAGKCQVGELLCLYALMEYADQSLAQLLEQRPLAEHEVREMLAPTLSALAYLHERKFVHGRLKPSNILAVGDQLKLASDAVCAVGESAGSVSTVSLHDAPETHDGIRSAAGDIWALGVTLCEALTRHLPSGLHEAAGEVGLPADLHPPFRQIVVRCLSRNPRDRPQVAELQAWLRGEPMIDAAAAPLPPAAIPSQRSAMPEPAADQRAAAKPSMAGTPSKETSPVETPESQAASVTAATSESDTTPGLRLVIRAHIIPENASRTTALRHSNRRVLALVLGALTVLTLIWIGISVLRTNPTSTPAVNEEAQDVEARSGSPAPTPREAAPLARDEPPPKPAPSAAETASANLTPARPKPSDAKSSAPQARAEPDAPSSSVREVIPDVSRSARETVRGTVRVVVRVIVDKQGNVVAATSDDPGPSRYFERLALEAAKKWTFAPTAAEEQRIMLVRFGFRRDGTTARAEPLQ